MAECNWKPELHGGKPCPKHGNAGQGSNHQVRISGGKYQTRIGGDGGDWEDISKEEFDELKDGGYEEFDATVDDDFGFDEDELSREEEYIRGSIYSDDHHVYQLSEDFSESDGVVKFEDETGRTYEMPIDEFEGKLKSGELEQGTTTDRWEASRGEKNVAKEKPAEEKPDEDFTFELNRVGKQLREVGFNLTTNEEVANSYKKKPDEYVVEERTNPEGKKFWTIDRKTKLAKGQRRRTKDGGFEIRRSPDDEWQQVTEEEYNDVAYEDYKEPFKKKNESGDK